MLSCAASMGRAKTASAARNVLGRIDERIALLRHFIPWPALIASWELERSQALQIMREKGFT